MRQHTITAFRKDAIHKYPTFHRQANTNDSAKRGRIKEFSVKSSRRLLFVLRNTDVQLNAFITLTVPQGHCDGYEQLARWRNAFLTCLRREFAVKHYLWFLEFQSNGSPHLHVYAKIGHYEGDSYGQVIKRMRQRWHSIADGDRSHHESFMVNVTRLKGFDAAAKYAYGYAMKREQKTAPATWNESVGRWWGHSKSVTPKPHFTRAFKTILDVYEAVLRADQRSYEHMFSVWHRWFNPTPEDLERGWTPLPSSVYFDLGQWMPRGGGV